MPKTKLQKIGIIAKSTIGEENPALVRRLLKELREKYHKEVRLDNYSAACMDERAYEKKDLIKWAHMLITLGGDGTLLKTAREIQKRKIVVLGVNLGTLGFLTEVAPKKLFGSLARIFKGGFVLDERVPLRVTVYRQDKKIWTSLALNDAVVNQGSFSRLIKLKTEVNQRKVNVFKADGLIISTPTGSTGHSLSAGGPIVHPKLSAFVITPICPSSLSHRPIVIPNDRQIKLILETHRRYEDAHNIVLTLDGQIVFPLVFGDSIRIRASVRRFYLIRLTGGNYYKMLRSKLNWGRYA